MHLQSLELFGFKSFADKTQFNFHEGVTAVVGPNGCGKSNVCDAVRWVLGEQSAKALRGGEMADVIFNGTDSRKPLGFAEVSLTFTDCGGELGVDWHDVRVTRRIYRDGNSEYFLNKTLCRLKDIHTLFADTGVGRSAYSIMEQGKIDLILSSRPEDRRSVFEEAAGITRYKTQKKEALRKLEATEANLLRISDIIKEVKRQIGSLQRQAGKARRYQTLHADLQVLDSHFSYRKMQRLDREFDECGEEIARVSRAEAEMREEITAGENGLADLRLELDAIDERISTARSQWQQLENEIATNRSRIEFNEQRGTELRELIERSGREIASANEKLREHEAQVDAANALLEETARLLAQKTEQLTEFSREAYQRRAARAALDEKLQAAQLNLSKAELRATNISDELTQLQERRAATDGSLGALGARIAASKAAELEAKVLDARTATESEQQSVEELLAAARAREDELRARQNAAQDLERQHGIFLRAIAEKESRLDVLRQLNEEGEGLAKGSQALLKGEQFAFAGALAAQLEVAPELVPAIEAALGRNLHALVLREPARAVEIIEHLNTQQLGQAALALGETNDELVEMRLPENAIGWAADKVRAPENLSGLVRHLLHGIALFETLPAALAARQNSRVAAVTWRGEFISRDGVLFGGSGKVRVDSLLERKTRIDSLTIELGSLQREEAALSERKRESELAVSSAQSALEVARTTHQHAHAAQTAAISKITEMEREHHVAARDLEILKSEHDSLARQIALADERRQSLNADRAELEQEITGAHGAIAQITAQRTEAQKQEGDATEGLAELRIVLATHEQKQEALLAQRAPMLSRQNELSELIANRRGDIASYEKRLVAQAAETEAAKSSIERQGNERARRENEIGQMLAERSAQHDTINAREQILRESRHRLSEMQEKRGAQTVRQTQLQLQREHLVEHVTQRYQIDLREFAPDSFAHEKIVRAQLKKAEIETPNDEELQRIIADLTRQLDSMGPVNLDAVQEYDELEERYQFLETQNNDLTNSRRELLDVIARINETTQKLFGATFAQVRVNFREMFGELFGGGRADLQLLDENDALNCGIEIIAKPPGKQLQTISLLSGGERTMTAVALLFAIYMVRPSPFCVLDEMDAPLDESNINRFIKVLERFVQQSQFIIITHNKRTIAKADVLYGVTMEERGVSKLVGIKLSAPRRNGSSNGHAEPVQEVIATQRTFPTTEEIPSRMETESLALTR